MVGSIKWTGLLCLARQSSAWPQETNVLRVNTRLVEVDVVVHSKGQAVADLKQDDFTVLDNGKPQKVAAFNIISSRTTPGKSIPLPPGAVSNRLTAEGQEPAGITIVLYDMLNTALEDQSWARQALVHYVDTLQSGDHFALYSLDKTLSVIQDFTDDPERIRRAARRASPEASTDRTADDLAADLLASAPDLGDAIANGMQQNAIMSMQDMAQINRAVITTKALELIAQHLQGLPGRKKLIWISSSFAAQTTDIRSHNGQQTIEHKEFGNEINHAVRAQRCECGRLSHRSQADQLFRPRVLETRHRCDELVRGRDRRAGVLRDQRRYRGHQDGRGGFRGHLRARLLSRRYQARRQLSFAFRQSRAQRRGSSPSQGLLRDRPEAADRKPAQGIAQRRFRDAFGGYRHRDGRAFLEPYARQAGVFQLTMSFNLQELHLEREKNNWVALIQLATYFPAAAKPNGTEESIKITLTEQRLREALANGYTMQRLMIVGEP